MVHSLELFDENGHHIREVGREYGTTTGRPRRVVGLTQLYYVTLVVLVVLQTYLLTLSTYLQVLIQ